MAKSNNAIPTVELFNEAGKRVICNADDTARFRAKGFEPAGVKATAPVPVVKESKSTDFDFGPHGLIVLRGWATDAGMTVDGKPEAQLRKELQASGYVPKGV